MSKKFFKVGTYYYNEKYVMYVNCDDKKCIMTLANTKAYGGGAPINGLLKTHSGKTYNYEADTQEYMDIFKHFYKNA